jgi:hypothetical protein
MSRQPRLDGTPGHDERLVFRIEDRSKSRKNRLGIKFFDCVISCIYSGFVIIPGPRGGTARAPESGRRLMPALEKGCRPGQAACPRSDCRRPPSVTRETRTAGVRVEHWFPTKRIGSHTIDGPRDANITLSPGEGTEVSPLPPGGGRGEGPWRYALSVQKLARFERGSSASSARDHAAPPSPDQERESGQPEEAGVERWAEDFPQPLVIPGSSPVAVGHDLGDA